MRHKTGIHNCQHIICDNTLGNHGIHIHIFHCKVFHGFFITISGSRDQIIAVFCQLPLYFYSFFIFLDRKKDLPFSCQSCNRQWLSFTHIPLILLQHIFCRILKIKDQSHAKAHVITRPCVRLFFCVSLHDYTLLRGDSCAAKKWKWIFYVKLIVFIILSTDCYSTVTAIILGILYKNSIRMILHCNFLIVSIYHILNDFLHFFTWLYLWKANSS